MKNLITYLKALWSRVADSQSSDVRHDCRRSDLRRSPSGLDAKWKQNPFMRFAVVLTLIFTIGIGQMRGAGTTVTYAQSSSSAASVSSGTAPTGSTVTFSNSYSTKDQVTNGNSMALTLTGYKGYKITAIKLSMHSNAKQGSGTFSAVAGTTTLASISSNTGFNAWYDNTSYGSSYRDVNVTMTNSTYEIKKDEDVVITITCPSGKSNNSLYCQSFTITYEAAGGGCSNAVVLSKGTATNGTVNTISSASVATCSATASDRRVTVTITPAACHDAPTNLTWTRTTGTVSASKQSGPTGNGDGTYSYVYQFAQNDNGAGTFGVTCTAKAAGKTVNFNAGPGTCLTSSLTETCDGSGVTLPAVTASGVCKGWTTFAGWATAAVNDSSTTSGVTLYAAGSTYYPSSDNETLYAVFSKTKGGGSSTASSESISSTSTNAVTLETGKPITYTCSESNTYSNPARIYKNKSITIAGGTITSISLTGVSDYAISNMTANTGTLTTDGDNGTWTGSASSITFTASTAQARISAISVTYSGGSTTSYISVPGCCTDPGLAYGTGSVTEAFGADAFTNPLTNSHSVAVTYSSSDETVATVDSEGEVTILKAGSTTITASSAAQTVVAVSYCADEASYTLTVNKANISPTLTYDPAAVTVGSTLTSFTLSGNSGSGSVSYSSSNDAIATVNSSGVVTGVAPGTVTITATIAATTNYNGNTATSNTITVNAAACTGVNSLHTGNKDQGGWVTNQCFEDADWGAADDAIYVGAFPLTNECYVGWAGGNSYYGAYWAVGGIKTYDIPTGRTLGWNSGNYYESYPGGALGTFHIYKNSKDENYYLRFKPSSYILRTGSNETSWTSRDMTVSGVNANYYESDFVTLTSTLISEHAYVDLKANNGDGHVWCNFSNDRTASGNVKVKNGASTFRATDLQASDNGTYGKFQIDITQDVDNWKLAFVPYFHITYNANGGTGSTAASSYVEVGSTAAAAANGFTAPTGKQFGGWATSADGSKAYDPTDAVTLNSNVELFAIWTDINYTVTVNQNPNVSATTTGQTSSAHYNGTINLTTTVPSGYRFVNWTTSDGFSITNPTSATTASFTMPAKNVTVTANFQQTHTVDWYVGGSAPANKIGDDGQTTVVDHGGKIEDFPATTPDGSACDRTFVGWTNTSSYVHGTSPLFNDVAGSPTINADANFYAVFAEGGNTEYVLTPAASLTAGEYVIAAYDDANSKYLALTGAVSAASLGSNSDMVNETTGFTISEGKFTTLPTGACEFVLTAYTGETDNGFYIQNPADDKYLDYQTTTNRRLWFYAATDYVDEYDNPTTPWAAWYGVALSKDGFPDNGMYLKYVDETYSLMSNGSGTTFVRGYANDNSKYKPIYLFKKTGGATGHTINCADCGSSVTPTYTAAPTGGTVSVTKSAAAVASGSTVKTCTSVDLTVTITPASHYTLTGFTATGLSTGTATISPAVNTVVPTTSAQTFTVTVSAGATGTLNLTPTLTPETPLTITFIPTVAGATVGSIGTIYSGDDFDFPSVSNLPGGFCADFLGWVDFTGGETFDGDGTRTTAPSELITAGTNSGAITTDKTYKAVYGESETSEAEGYFKVTAAPEAPATWADNHYLIVYEGDATHDAVAFDGSLGTLDATSDGVAVTITSGSIPYSNTLAASEFRIAAITGGYSIQSASGVYIGKEAYSNGLDESTTDAAVNTIAYTSGATVITGVGGCALKYNYASDQLRFRYYKTGQQDIQLYKYGTAPVVTYTYTTAPSCGDKYRVTVADVAGGSPSASPKYCADGTTISLVANPSTGYSFTSWTITKDGTNPLQDVTSTLLGANSTTANTSFSMPDYDVTVTAAYSITNYNITYNNLNGATNSNPATYNVASADIEFVAPGARAGYIFKGWYDDAVYTNQVTGIPNGSTGAVTVYAKWAVGYTITWDNAIGVNPASTGVEDGNAIGTLPIPTGSCTFDGTTYSNFVGWYTGTISSVGTAASDAGTEITAATVPTASATYHAVYTNMPDYSGTNTSNVTLPANPTSPVATAKIKVSSEDDAPEYDGIKIGTSKNKTGSFTFTVPSGTTKITLHGVAWSGKTASVTLATSVGTISPSTAQSLDDNSGASDNSPFTITSNTTLTFNLANVSSEATITVSNSSERVIVWGINASSASGSDVGYITSCCDNLLAAPTMNSPTVRTSTAITLSWNTVPNATGYKVSWNGGDWEDVGTATTYEKTSLEPGNDYSYKVIAKYTSPYCGASAYEGVVSTKPVFSVTYQRGSGTGSCSATGSIPAVAYYEEGATVSLAASNTFSLSGNTFDAWSSEQVALTASSTSFTMPAENVVITATWMANVDKFYDRMHNLTSGEGSHTDAQGKHYITREGCNYTVPALEDNTDGETACHTSHYVLLGWIAGGHLDSEGKVKSGEENYIFTGGGTRTAGGNTYYAVWAEVTE